jgi:hypothetical protein
VTLARNVSPPRRATPITQDRAARAVTAHGMVGYALDAEMGRKTFWTIRRPASTPRNSWRVTTSTGMLDGFLPAVPDRPTPPVPRVADVSAGSVGCPQPRPD